MKFADSPKAVAQASDVTFTMVTNAAALAAVTDGPDGLLAGIGPGKFHIDMSTVSPEVSRALAAKVREKGADMIDAPVSGSVITLQQGKLSVMVGGRKETFERLKPLLLDVGPKVTHVGDNGVALSMKIAVNLQLAVQMMAFCEGVLLAEKSGIPREVAVDVMIHSAIASPMIVYRGPFVLQQPEEAWFDCNMMQKDMLLAMELGRKLNVPVPTTAVSNEFLTAARGMGWEKLDFAVMFDVLARMSGVPTMTTAAQPKEASETSRFVAADVPADGGHPRNSKAQVNELYTRALMPGLAHLYIGEEAVAVGVCEALEPTTTSPARIAVTDIVWRKAPPPIECSPNCWEKKPDTARAKVVPCTLRTRRPAIWEQTRSCAAAPGSRRERLSPRSGSATAASLFVSSEKARSGRVCSTK